jgi:hypothetical protein
LSKRSQKREMGPLIRSVRKAARESVGYVQAQLYTSGFLSKEGLTLPDFLGIGAQRAGTTWLHQNLRCHPQIYLPKKKEQHYFDWRPHRSLRSYSEIFAGQDGLVKGEITPYSSALPMWSIRYIHRLIPTARLILLLRNPIDRAWSQALLNLVVRKHRPYETVTEEEFLAHFRHQRTVSRGDYLGMLDKWLSVFPQEQLFIGFFEDIKERPRELLSAVFEHVGVSADVDWAAFPYNQVVHRGAGISLPDRYRAVLEQMYAAEIDRIADRFGGWTVAWRCR